MKNIWTKNKWTLIAVSVYSMIVILFGELITPLQIGVLLSSFLVLPYLFNFRINSDSIFRNIIAGLIFGFYITPFSFSSFGSKIDSMISFKYQSEVFYWFLILFLNLCYVFHRNSYKLRKSREDLADERDNKIDMILHPVKNKFFL